MKVDSITSEKGPFELIDSESDVEIFQNVTVLATIVSLTDLGSSRFKRYSKWTSLVKAVAYLCHISHSFSKSNDKNSCRGWHFFKTSLADKDFMCAEHTIIRCVQHEVYAKRSNALEQKKTCLITVFFTILI